MQESQDGSFYLGLPNVVSCSRNAAFGYMKDRIRNCLQKCDNQILSRARNEVLLKTVI